MQGAVESAKQEQREGGNRDVASAQVGTSRQAVAKPAEVYDVGRVGGSGTAPAAGPELQAGGVSVGTASGVRQSTMHVHVRPVLRPVEIRLSDAGQPYLSGARPGQMLEWAARSGMMEYARTMLCERVGNEEYVRVADQICQVRRGDASLAVIAGC